MKRLIHTVIFLFCAAAVHAQNGISVDAPRVVGVGEPFRVEFTLNEEPKEFTAPAFTGFDVVAGPSVSKSSSVNIVNGNITRSSSVIYTYVLLAQEAGNLQIGSAEATLKNGTVKSSVLPIEAVKESGGSAAAGSGSQSGNSGQTARSNTQSNSIAKDDIVLLLTVNKRSAYPGETVVAQVKLLTRVQLAGIEGAKYPTFSGFWTQDLEVADTPWERIEHNGKIYDSKVLREYLLFPQKKGELKIEPMSMDIVARIVMESQGGGSLFDSFFGGGARMQDVRRKVTSAPVTIQVNDYPSTPPASFSGAVGSFTMESTLGSDLIAANNSSNITVTIKGEGNLPLIEEPKLKLPDSFELYKVKSSDNYTTRRNGATGSKTFEYPFIARAKGEYHIEPLEFTYFNPTTKAFVTLRSNPFDVEVTADNSSTASSGNNTIISGVTKEELKILGSDIRFIRTGNPHLAPKGGFLIASPLYFGLLALMILLFAAAAILLKRSIQASKDVVRVKSRRATKIALNRLKTARKSLQAGENDRFYQETLKALWGYVGDKLNIGTADLSKERIAEALIARGIAQEEVDRFLSVISDCEFAQYAPASSEKREDIYNAAVNIITQFEDKL